ncbi:MAG: glycosyltransferase family A protein [Sulfurovum sp.]|nr:glycosyltransferase family A protein [Sulfurovum sp.]
MLPTYNAQKYIEEAIESVINQTYIHWELIIINDGSTDNTSSLIASFSDTRIISLTQENQGVSHARNRGLDIAKGKYITFLDADDVLPRQSIEKRYLYLEQNKDIDIVDGIINVKNSTLDRRY